MTAQNYLTGQLVIELEMLPDTPIELRYRGHDKDVLEIPTVLSPMGKSPKASRIFRLGRAWRSLTGSLTR